MITKRTMIKKIFHIKSIIFLLSIFLLKVNAETKITAKGGDTLFKLSKQYGVSLKELMHKNNFNDASTIVEGEIIIIPLKNNNDENNVRINHKVIKGETLYKIARDYNVNIKDIMSINNLDNESILKPNQIILLPDGAIYKKTFPQTNVKLASRNVFYHQTSKVEKISEIAKLHNVTREEIIILNKLDNPTTINPNTKLKIRKKKTSKWLKYKSLTINWSEWKYLDGNYITKAKNKKNKVFYIAISCKKRALNNTLNNSSWTSWYFPKRDFEFKLINDFCEMDVSI